MRYADTLLSDGEQVVLRTRQHWLAIFLEARWAVILWAVAIALLVLSSILRLNSRDFGLVGMIALVCIVVGLVIFGWRYWQWWSQDYMVTNRRLMKVTGIFNKRSADSSLEKINDAVLDQNLLGRIMNFGDLDILTAADQAIDSYRMLQGPKEFKRVMLNQKHGLEMEYQGPPPSPPMRTAASDMNGEPVMRSAPWQAERAPEQAPQAMDARPPMATTDPMSQQPMSQQPTTADEPTAVPWQSTPAPAPETPARPRDANASLEITQTLARLADLRDQGAITEEEYAAKKEDLLGRL
jgi:hypothetical protein